MEFLIKNYLLFSLLVLKATTVQNQSAYEPFRLLTCEEAGNCNEIWIYIYSQLLNNKKIKY